MVAVYLYTALLLDGTKVKAAIAAGVNKRSDFVTHYVWRLWYKYQYNALKTSVLVCLAFLLALRMTRFVFSAFLI